MTTDLDEQLRTLGLRHTAETLSDLIALATKGRWSAQQILEHAANVRRLRRRLGLTQDELAAKTKFDPRMFQRIERARLDLKMSTFVRLAEALGVPPAALLA